MAAALHLTEAESSRSASPVGEFLASVSQTYAVKFKTNCDLDDIATQQMRDRLLLPGLDPIFYVLIFNPAGRSGSPLRPFALTNVGEQNQATSLTSYAHLACWHLRPTSANQLQALTRLPCPAV